MKNLFKSVLKYFDINSDIKKRRAVKEDTRTMLQRKLVDFRQRARQYKESGDPYRFAYLGGYVDSPKRDLSKYVVTQANLYESRDFFSQELLQQIITATDIKFNGQYKLISVTPNKDMQWHYLLTWELKP